MRFKLKQLDDWIADLPPLPRFSDLAFDPTIGSQARQISFQLVVSASAA